jgi:acetyltransferase-like isoleucine patch superfamily enzyme
VLASLTRQYRVARTRLLWGTRMRAVGRRCLFRAGGSANHPRVVEIGAHVTLLPGWSLNDLTPHARVPGPKIRIGSYCTFLPDFQCNAAVSVEIQDYVLTAARVLVTDSDHIVDPDGEHTTLCRDFVSEPVVIEHDCWLGQNAVVCKGVRIGHHSIVGANSVVVEDVPPCSIVGGVPARLIGSTRQA